VRAYATQILGDHGADIIKVDSPQGDEVRQWGPPFRDGDASYFIGVNRNKRSLRTSATGIWAAGDCANFPFSSSGD
jgi:formyl-CoA transferase